MSQYITRWNVYFFFCLFNVISWIFIYGKDIEKLKDNPFNSLPENVKKIVIIFTFFLSYVWSVIVIWDLILQVIHKINGTEQESETNE